MKLGYLRLTSLVTAFLFSSNILAFSAPVEPLHLAVPIATPAFEIPETLGTICERYQVPDSPDQSPLIIHIQDAHGNYEAQKNIEALLRYLNQKYNIRLLFLEGAASKLDPELFRFFENPDLNLKVADILTRAGEFSGAETFLLARPRNVSAYGIEDIPTYRKDLELFRKVLKEGARAQTFLNRLQTQIQYEEARLTSRDLKDFARAWKRERKNPDSLSSFIEVLNKYALKHLGLDLSDPKNQLRFPALLRMLKLKDLEKRVHLEKALQEKDRLIRSLNLEALKNIEKEKSPRLLLEKIHSEFGERFQPDAFPNFTLYVRYLAFKSEIEAEELFREIDSLGRELFERLARTPEEQKFVRSIQNLDVLEKLLKLELSRSDYSKIGQIGEAVRELPILDDALAFYRLAEERENHFLSKITSRMTDQKASRAILITGGFHSEGMKERFRKRGISFVEIRPRITSADESQQIYRQALLGEAQSDTFEKSQIAYVAQLISYLEQSQMGANTLIRRNHIQAAAASLGQIRNASARALFLEEAQEYIDFLARTHATTSEDLARPDAFFVLGHLNVRTYLEFAKLWKSYLPLNDKKQEHGIPILISGGIGRGTSGLIQSIFRHYGRLLSNYDNAILSDPKVSEAEILQWLLVHEGILPEHIHLEKEATRTGQNFEFSWSQMKQILSDRVVTYPKIQIVTHPAANLRVWLTGLKKWHHAIHDKNWKLIVKPIFTLQIRDLSELELTELFGNMLGFPQNFRPEDESLNRKSEIERILEYGSKPDPYLAPIDFSQTDWNEARVIRLREEGFKQFLSEVVGASLGLKAEREQAWEQHFREEGKFNEDEIPSLARLMTQMSSPYLFLPPEERERISLTEILEARQSFSTLAGGQDRRGRRIPGTHDILSRLNASKDPVRFLERLLQFFAVGVTQRRLIVKDYYPYTCLYAFLVNHQQTFGNLLDHAEAGDIEPVVFWNAKAASLGEIEDAEKFLTEQKINFDPRFNHRVQQLLKIQRADWGSGEWAEYKRLRSDAQKAYDWMTGWIRKSPYYETLKGHPPVLLSMEGVVSAVEEGEGPRLTSFAGGLGILFGEWIRAIAYLGGVTTFDSKSEAPEFTIFLPDYGGGTAVSEVHSFGYPNLDAHNVQRPQNYGIGLFQDPRYPDENFLVEIPMYQEGKMIEVTVGFRCVRVGSLQVIMPTTDLEKNHPSVRGIFHQLYQGRSSSQERFKQEWILGLAAYKLRRKLDIPNGPIHLNETATFPYLVAAVRGYMEEGFTYDEALEWVGSKTIFFTHTFVHDGIDRFMDHEVPLGHYIRLYFEQSGNPEVSKQAGKVANWMIHGRKSTQDGILLPGFEQTFSRGVFSPLHFIVKLVYTFNGSVVAVSQLNAIKAGEFFVDQGILTREELAQKPVIGITNGVDHLYWMIPEIAARMNWHEPSPTQREPEAILDPQDPQAKEIYRILHPHAKDIPPCLEKGGKPQLPDPELRNILRTYKEKAIRMIREKVREQYIRETSRIEDRLGKGEAVAVELERLHALRVRWARWIGQENAEEWVKSWEAKPAEEQKPFRKELNEKEWVKLLDPDLFLGVWARRIVKYKRMLFTVFGKYMPEIESRLSADRALSPSDMDVLIKEMKNKNAFGEFIDLVVGKKMQLIFAGKTFSEDGRSNVALLHRIIERLSEEYPEIQDRVLFLEGYDETESQFHVRAADVWLNTPKRPLEASGTSGMKVSKMNVFASPNGDGWAAGGIRDGLNGRAKPIPLINQDHPDVWPRSGGPKDERPEEAKQAKSPEAYYFETEANNFFGMLREEAERYYSQSPEWLRAIRRWIYFTALVYDIRGEFTGRYVPSFSDIPGGQEKGIFELYADAVRKESEARQRIEKRRQAQAATAESLGFYERNPASILHVARTLFENTLWLPEADQTVFMWYMEQLDLEGKPAGARKLDPAVRVFNQSLSPFLEALGLNKETANTRLPFIVSEGLIASKREEADKIARQISNIMRPGDLFLAIWNGREKSPVIQKLYRESGGKFKVRDLPVHMASNPRITQIIKPLQTPPVYISALSESGELELTLREGDRIKLNMNQLLKKGVDPLQVMRLVRQLADYPKLRKDRFTKAGFEFIKEGGYWEVGNHFVERIHEIYASHTTRQITLRAA